MHVTKKQWFLFNGLTIYNTKMRVRALLKQKVHFPHVKLQLDLE